MNFASGIFLYIFLPASLIASWAIYWFRSKKGKGFRFYDIILILISLFFYAWAPHIENVLFLILFILLTFALGKIIERTRKNDWTDQWNRAGAYIKQNSVPLLFTAIGVAAFIFLLYQFKYKDVFSFSSLFEHFTRPLGISFLFFSSLSYLIDIYRGAPAGSFTDAALYICYFPKVISGPIVQWNNFRQKLADRVISLTGISEGLCEIVCGLAKKVIIADYFGSEINNIRSLTTTGIDVPSAWLITVLYMFQIYYDFSAYSNIACGISRCLGIPLERNFYFPYLSVSISEFWRRWHISLGAWFRTYVYFPLGGSRKGTQRTLLNLFLVMLLSGIWHGAGLAYIFWGVLHGVCIVVEKIVSDKSWYQKIPRLIKWAFSMFIVMLAWQLFRLGSFTSFIAFAKTLLGFNNGGQIVFTVRYFFSKKLIIMLLIAFLGSTAFGLVSKTLVFNKWKTTTCFHMIKYIVLLVLLIISMVVITNSTYSPFIYFQY